MNKTIGAVAVQVTIAEDDIVVSFMDGAELRVSFEWFPALKAATAEQRNAVAISRSGEELYWILLKEEISVSALVRDAEHFAFEEKLGLQVPNDFPWDTTPASLAGAQLKLAARKIGGKVVVGLTAAERFQRWDLCEDLAQQLVAKALNDAAKYPQNSRDVTLRRIRRAIEGKGWTTVVETDWLTERLRILLDW
jgi:hypothetical protein